MIKKDRFLIKIISFGMVTSTFSNCKTTIDTSSTVTSATVSGTNAGTLSGTTITVTAPSGTVYSSVAIDLGSQFLATNVCSTATILNLTGTASCAVTGTSTVVSSNSVLRSDMYRTVGTTQITLPEETTTYSGNGTSANLSTALSNYREIPDTTLDDEGYKTPDVGGCAGTCTPIVSITWAQHISYVNCGLTQSTIAARIADCTSLNPSSATWNGATNGSSGEGKWSLVSRSSPVGTCTASAASCQPKEVWKDQTTGLVWSSIMSAHSNWCLGAGNFQPADVSCSNTAYQPSKESFCAEGPTSVPAAGTCVNSGATCVSSATCTAAGCGTSTWTPTVENWPAGSTYDAAKGGMGARSTPGVRWRLPSLHDYEQAEVDGIRFVMPEMGALNTTSESEWTATTYSAARTSARAFQSDSNLISSVTRTSSRVIRCVGR